ncbi:malate synthase G [Aestuariibacter sp. GS-14]|uniref:malate synthase G n=1 Tax=Aestuariibacter sp. GS-14 TaxID=2590670 RepID=UPI001127F27A|nr:malate synthase G [Aestuariibacter sp. GS-14]TPV62088.1 malate synthase G [Aestuariibacter sp. GS-14]
MQDYIQRGRMQVASVLDNFINEQALPGSGVEPADFWQGFEAVLAEFVAPNKALLEKRDSLQAQLDAYHQAGKPATGPDYKQFLQDIGYLLPEPADFSIETSNVDAEMATMAGPQLVVPINNARYALNAANARWGSLYDALYGTDVVSEDDGATKSGGYNPIRGAKVVATAREWLNTLLPLASGRHEDAVKYSLAGNTITVSMKNGESVTLQNPDQFKGYQGSVKRPDALLFEHNGLHFELQIDSSHPIGKTDPAGVKDILVEAALTTIMDCEDSVAAVDAEDKTLVYSNWLGLMKGSLSITMDKAGKSFTRSMNADRQYQTPNGDSLTLSGRSLMFVRNVGHLMTNDAILFDGEEVPEGIMDGVITSLIAKHDLLGNSPFKNTRTGSIYIVKPKMHGPEEVAFSNALFGKIEEVLGLEPFTLKMGIMDEERRTSVNLKACIAAAKQRTVFINTGFLDRTGDEIHTSMQAGIFADKASLKTMTWIQAYEKANVATGLACGLSGKAQIGKGMWPIPDQMAQMMTAKIGHPKAGANTAWVPSPTAATLHALHYHQVDVFGLQQTLAAERFNGIDDILTIPLLSDTSSLSDDQIQREIDNNVQGILGYVVRWVHQGVGCSKVPDINNVGLMEDRATLRISSQHLANWLAHGVISETRVQESLERMAALVDKQNADDPEYLPMTPDTASSIGFQAASELIFKGKEQPNGYTEPLLHQKRKEMKAALRAQ